MSKRTGRRPGRPRKHHTAAQRRQANTDACARYRDRQRRAFDHLMEAKRRDARLAPHIADAIANADSIVETARLRSPVYIVKIPGKKTVIETLEPDLA